MNRSNILLCGILLCLTFAGRLHAADFVDFSKSTRLIEVDVHALGGTASVSQNYVGMFPQIQNLNVDMGSSLGIGARAVFGIRNYLGFGTMLDLMSNAYNMDMSVMGADGASMSAVFLKNRFYSLNIPVFVSFRFNPAPTVRWEIDAGLYYAYGLGGTQRQRIFRASVNAVEELVPQIESVKTGYFDSSATFINGFERGDYGIHLATCLSFGRHFLVGARFQHGIRNASRQLGIKNPTIRNRYLQAVIGYRF